MLTQSHLTCLMLNLWQSLSLDSVMLNLTTLSFSLLQLWHGHISICDIVFVAIPQCLLLQLFNAPCHDSVMFALTSLTRSLLELNYVHTFNMIAGCSCWLGAWIEQVMWSWIGQMLFKWGLLGVGINQVKQSWTVQSLIIQSWLVSIMQPRHWAQISQVKCHCSGMIIKWSRLGAGNEGNRMKRRWNGYRVNRVK